MTSLDRTPAVDVSTFREKHLSFVWNYSRNNMESLSAKGGSSFTTVESKEIAKALSTATIVSSFLRNIKLVDAGNRTVYHLEQLGARIAPNGDEHDEDDENVKKTDDVIPISVPALTTYSHGCPYKYEPDEPNNKLIESSFTMWDGVPSIPVSIKEKQIREKRQAHNDGSWDDDTILEIKKQRVEVLINDIFDEVGDIWLKIFPQDVTDLHDKLSNLMMRHLTIDDISQATEESVLEKCVDILHQSENVPTVHYELIRHYVSIAPVKCDKKRRTLRLISDLLVCDILGSRDADKLKTNMADTILDILHLTVKFL